MKSWKIEFRRPRSAHRTDRGRHSCLSSEAFMVLAVAAEFGAGPDFSIK
jgi:hypothetical protein